MLRCLDQNIWVAEQSQEYFGLSVGTRMTVIRSPETGRLVILSPTKPTPELEEELSGLGIVSDLVAPNSYHHLWLIRLTTRIAGGFNRLEPSVLERLATSDKASLRTSIQQVLSWDFDRVIVAHGGRRCDGWQGHAGQCILGGSRGCTRVRLRLPWL